MNLLKIFFINRKMRIYILYLLIYIFRIIIKKLWYYGIISLKQKVINYKINIINKIVS